MKKSQYSKEVLDKVAEIYSLCLQINALGKFTTFYSYLGHANCLDVTVQLTAGVDDESDAVTVYDTMTGPNPNNYLALDMPYSVARLNKCIERLKELRNLSIPEAQINLTYDY
ncbi:hypothetical protein ACO2Q8_07945 [Larkinella sp. VNQ87]|uniref:hypothetical protein n=1 Tax=Larkinella sp. VNQ87 TaxID=3400921 RepID=UPI003C0F90AC